MRFVKMHGIGNDYVYVNGFEETVTDPAALAPRIADRHFGVGGDGLILLLPPAAGVDAHVRMRMFNADGSESEMCGNGVRCVCKLAHDAGVCNANPMRVQTGNGVLTLSYTLDKRGQVEQVTVDMGEPVLEPGRIPVKLPDNPDGDRVVNYPLPEVVRWPDDINPNWLTRTGVRPEMTCVSMGNPHLVLYCDNVAAVPLEQVGPVLEHLAVFPNRINAHFVQIHSSHEVTMRTWERGSGITLACGTGAAAVCVAGVLTSRTDRKLLAHLPGGDLELAWHEPNNHVSMTGPATTVFHGTWPQDTA